MNTVYRLNVLLRFNLVRLGRNHSLEGIKYKRRRYTNVWPGHCDCDTVHSDTSLIQDVNAHGNYFNYHNMHRCGWGCLPIARAWWRGFGLNSTNRELRLDRDINIHIALRYFTTSTRKMDRNKEKSTSGSNCWNCGEALHYDDKRHSHPADRFYCPETGCGVMQPTSYMNYFEQFGLPTAYSLDVSDLTKKYKRIQQRLHPDKSMGLSQKEKDFAVAHSALINKAYDTLSKPVPRALYMLELNGLTLEEDVAVDHDLLMEILELNEEIEDCDDESRLREIFDTNRTRINNLVSDISAAFQEHEYGRAKLLIAKIKYFVNIEEKIKEKTYFH